MAVVVLLWGLAVWADSQHPRFDYMQATKVIPRWLKALRIDYSREGNAYRATLAGNRGNRKALSETILAISDLLLTFIL